MSELLITHVDAVSYTHLDVYKRQTRCGSINRTYVYNGIRLYQRYLSVKGENMAHIQLIYGDEPQLIEEEKRKFLSAYPDLPVTVLDDEAGPQKISEKLCEDSLFGDQKVFCLVNLPIIRKSGKNSDAWVPLYELIMEYNGDNPIVLIYHNMIDKRIKQNKELLNKISNRECKRLEGADLVMWIRQYCTSNGFKMTPDCLLYTSQ